MIGCVLRWYPEIHRDERVKVFIFEKSVSSPAIKAEEEIRKLFAII